MPFTLAHPVAVLPIARWSRRAVLSALVVGSLMPDLGYFLPVDVAHDQSHSPAGVLWFCLPAGLAVYALFHLLLKRPLLGLLPRRLRVRVLRLPSARQTWPDASWTAVLASLLLGTLTHVFWDAFTHFDGLVVAALPVLRLQVYSIGGLHPIYAYKALQYGSSVFGMATLALLAARWLRQAAPVADPPAFQAPLALRAAVLVALVVVCSVVAATQAASALSGPVTVADLQQALVRAVVSSLAAAGAIGIGYSVLWHLRRA